MKTSATTKAPKKTKQDAAIEDLAPKSEQQVRGGKVTLQDFHFTQKVNTSSPS